MSIIIFLIILAVLIFVHELGHFLTAKLAKIRVDEFAIGFPPKLFSFKRGETNYAVNLIPFGGYVKIFGENPDDESLIGPDSKRSFVNQNRAIQAIVLVAGIVFNILFAWILFSISFTSGLPMSVADYAGRAEITNERVMITAITPKSPSALAGIVPGDTIIEIRAGANKLEKPNATLVQEFIKNNDGSKIELTYKHSSDESKTAELIPVEGLIKDRKAIGIAMDTIGNVSMPIWQAFIEGGKLTYNMTINTAIGLAMFIKSVFTVSVDFSQVSGPVGIASLVGEASKSGIAYLLTFTGFISINLALLNLIPFPALDGGRLLFVIIEAIRRKNINPKISNIVNGIGFALLILFMVVITFKDIAKLIG